MIWSGVHSATQIMKDPYASVHTTAQCKEGQIQKEKSIVSEWLGPRTSMRMR